MLITYGAYTPKSSNLVKNAAIISVSDTFFAVMAGCAIMPAVFAFGVNPTQCAGLVFDDPIETTEKIIGEMRGKYDFLIALTHVSYGIDAVLAIRFPEIDVIVGGDSHTWLRSPRKFTSHKRQYEPEETGGTHCVQDGEFGVCLGRLDMVLTDIGGRYRVKSYSGKLVPVRDVRPDPSINEILRKYIKE